MTRGLLVVLLVMAALVAAGCGKSTTTVTGPNGQVTTHTHVAFAKTKFLLHAGLAFGAFHRYIYDPLRAGDFRHPLSHKAVLAKGAVAAVFVIHELKIAAMDAQSSPLLSKLFSPITALGATIASLVHGFKSNAPDVSSISSVNGSIGNIKSSAASAGAPITESSPSL